MFRRKIIIYNLLVVLAFFSLVELAFHVFLVHPAWIPGFCLDTFRKYYNDYDRNIIQFNRECARYDTALYYTLRPGTFRFANREYDVDFHVNSRGLRDDDTALHHPRIISLGDSFAMGWGVAQNETYASDLSHTAGCHVLNAGISSYGTARELKLLKSLQTDSLKDLIIQYCSNDFEENKALVEGSFRISDQASYDKLCADQEANRKYYPFKYLICFTRILGKKLLMKDPYAIENSTAEEIRDVYADQAKAFLGVLEKSQLPSSVHIIVFCLDNYLSYPYFPQALAKEWPQSALKAKGTRMDILDASANLNREDYYHLDDHLTAAGHAKIAAMISPYIGTGQ